MNYYVEDHENGPLRANGAGGPPRTDKQPLLVTEDSDAYRVRREGDAPFAAAGAGASEPVVAAPLSHGSNPNSNAAQGHNTNYVQSDASVRRLMPVECERLQALPDQWTDLGGTADSKRYAALGDAVTSSVAEWIGRNIIASQERTT